MIRPATLLWMGLALTVGVGLFFLKYEVQAREEQLARLNAEIRRSQERIHVLKAEWAHLTDPARLHRLADRYLILEPVSPDRVVTLADLPRPADDPAPWRPRPRHKPAPQADLAAWRKP